MKQRPTKPTAVRAPASRRLTPAQRELVRWLVRATLDRQNRAHVSVAQR